LPRSAGGIGAMNYRKHFVLMSLVALFDLRVVDWWTLSWEVDSRCR
jgi:hypothetical protein